MITKKFEHQKKEICKISGKPIYTKKDKYCILLECDGDSIDSIEFYSNKLLKETLVGNMNSVREELLKKHQTLAGKMVKSLGGLINKNPAVKEYSLEGV